MEWVYAIENINDVAKQFWQKIESVRSAQSVIAFHGTMGSGKTTFIHALCSVKGVKDAVGSPTFTIINEYAWDCEGTKKPIFHMDLYRIKDEEEAIRAGIEDVLYSGYTCLVEWPEKAPGIFPADTIHVQIDLMDNAARRLKIMNN